MLLYVCMYVYKTHYQNKPTYGLSGCRLCIYTYIYICIYAYICIYIAYL